MTLQKYANNNPTFSQCNRVRFLCFVCHQLIQSFQHQHEGNASFSLPLPVGKGRAGSVICLWSFANRWRRRNGSPGLPGSGSSLFPCSLAGVGWGDSFVHSHPHTGLLRTAPAVELCRNRPVVSNRGALCQGSQDLEPDCTSDLPAPLLGLLQLLLSQFMNLQSGDKNSTYRTLSGNKFWQGGARQAGSTL